MLKKVLGLLAVLLLFPIVAYAAGNEDVSIDTPKPYLCGSGLVRISGQMRVCPGDVNTVLKVEYRKIKRPLPPTARAHPVAHPAPPGTTTRRASTREAAWAWQAVRKLATKSC
jgi:hypothetical protein